MSGKQAAALTALLMLCALGFYCVNRVEVARLEQEAAKNGVADALSRQARLVERLAAKRRVLYEEQAEILRRIERLELAAREQRP